MVRDVALKLNGICIHSITPEGGGGKSHNNNDKIDIYDRFKFNIEKRKGIASTLVQNIKMYISSFGTQGLVIYDGEINNVNCSDAGSTYSDILEIWESEFGINNPTIDQVYDEIGKATQTYPEINIFKYKICGFFIDNRDIGLARKCLRSLNEFYNNTKKYNLPYFGLTNIGIIKIDEKYFVQEDWVRIQGGEIISINQIYDIHASHI